MSGRGRGIVFVVALAFLLGGCTYTVRVADLTALSTKVTRIDIEKGERVKADACDVKLLGISLRSDAVNPEEPLDRILYGKNTDVLIDGVIYFKAVRAILYNKECYEMEGNIGKIKEK